MTSKEMFKLLTEEGRKKVESEYSTRRTVVMLLAFILVLIVGVIGPSFKLGLLKLTAD